MHAFKAKKECFTITSIMSSLKRRNMKIYSIKTLCKDLFNTWRKTLRILEGTFSVIILLALGMGGAIAVFEPIYSLIFATLPFPMADRLVRVGGDIPIFNSLDSSFEKREILSRIFSNVAAYSVPTNSRINIKVPDTGKEATIYHAIVTEEFFETLGIQPIKGSGFRRTENRTGIIISHQFWQKELISADDVIGKPLLVDERQLLIIVGIMPETFDFPNDTDVWICMSGRIWSGGSGTQYVGRLRPGISLEQAARDLKAMEFNVPAVTGTTWIKNKGQVLQSFQIVFYGDKLPLLTMMVTVAVLFLLLVCASVANFLITHGIRRKSEMATRMVFGATRWKLVCQLLKETLPLVVVGGVAGLAVANTTGIWLQTQFPSLKGGEVAIPVKIVFFTTLVMAVTIVSGLSPALRTSNIDLNTQLKSTSGSKRRFYSPQEVLVGAQLSLALALLIGVGILLRSLMFSIDIPINWASDEIVVLDVDYSLSELNNSAEGRTRLARFYQEARRQLETMPEVVSVGSLYPVPFSSDALWRVQNQHGNRIYKDIPSKDPYEAFKQQFVIGVEGSVSSNGFEMLGIPLIAGRIFTEAEIARQTELLVMDEEWRSKGVAIVNQVLAQSLWPGENAVGKIFYTSPSKYFEIVGVVSDFHIVSSSNTVTPAFYKPVIETWVFPAFLVKLHSNRILARFQSNFRQWLLDWDRGLKVQRLQELILDSKKDQLLALQLIGCFAGLGIMISVLGVYATSTLMASSRTREIGIRMAMGAQFSDILRLILLRSARVLVIGLPCGLFLGWALAHGLSSALYQVRYNDPAVWIYSCVIMLCLTIIAALIPAFKATLINPLDAMRNE